MRVYRDNSGGAYPWFVEWSDGETDTFKTYREAIAYAQRVASLDNTVKEV